MDVRDCGEIEPQGKQIWLFVGTAPQNTSVLRLLRWLVADMIRARISDPVPVRGLHRSSGGTARALEAPCSADLYPYSFWAGLAGGAARAQFSGAVEGFVRDSTGGVIPGADVTITDENLGLEREIPSNETGFFRVGELPAGSYSVSVASSGFRQLVYNRAAGAERRDADAVPGDADWRSYDIDHGRS